MLEDNDFIEKLNKQSYTSSIQQKPLIVEDLQRIFDDFKEKYGDNTGSHYVPKSLEEYRMILCLPSRHHEDDVPGTIIDTDNHHWEHLHLPIIVDDPRDVDREARIAWFKENFAHRMNTDGEPVNIISRLYENEGGQCQ